MLVSSYIHILYLFIISARENDVFVADAVERVHGDGPHGGTRGKFEFNIHVNVLVHLDRAREERVQVSLQ